MITTDAWDLRIYVSYKINNGGVPTFKITINGRNNDVPFILEASIVIMQELQQSIKK